MADATESQSGSPFHQGEQRVQTRVGVREEFEPWARKVVRPFPAARIHSESFGPAGATA